MARNPDSSFVLRGRKTPVRGKDTTYLTNTEKTLSTKNLSQTSLSSRPGTRNSLRSSGAWTGRRTDLSEGGERLASTADGDLRGENLFEKIQNGLRSRNSELSLDLRSLNSSFSKSLNKSVTFSDGHGMIKDRLQDEDEHSLDDMFEEELERLIMNDTMELNDPPRKEENLAGKPMDFATSQWYMEPVHLTKEASYPVFESLGAREQRVSSVKRTTGMLGTEMAQKKVSSSISLEEEVKKYFPVTFGEVPSVMQTLTPPPPMDSSTQNAFDRTARSILIDAGQSGNQNVMNASSSRKPMSASGRQQTKNGLASSVRTLKGHRRGFPGNGLSLRLSQGLATHDPQVKAVKDYNYLKASQQFVDQAVVASPFEYELAKLRMERLRLEEQRILDLKRQEELERIRGPEPKWYELKTPKFTYEHAKNNQLNNSKKDWQDLFDYRTALLSASHEFSKTVT